MTTTQNPNGCSYCDTREGITCPHTGEGFPAPEARIIDLMHPPK